MNKWRYDIVLLSVSCLFFVGCGCICTKRGEYVKTDAFKYKHIAEWECVSLYVEELKERESEFEFTVPISNKHYNVSIVVEGLGGHSDENYTARQIFREQVFPMKIRVVDEQNHIICEQYGRNDGIYGAIVDKHFATGNNGAGFFLTNDIKLQRRKKYKLYVSMRDLAEYKITLFVYKRTTVFFP